jgi:hypothetical protein
VLAQVVDEYRAQRLAELAVAAVNGVGDQPFGELDVVVGLTLIAADRLGGRDQLEQRPKELYVQVLLGPAYGTVMQVMRRKLIEILGHTHTLRSVYVET